MVSFLNHIASILSERGLTCGAIYPLCYYDLVENEPLLRTHWVSFLLVIMRFLIALVC